MKIALLLSIACAALVLNGCSTASKEVRQTLMTRFTGTSEQTGPSMVDPSLPENPNGGPQIVAAVKFCTVPRLISRRRGNIADANERLLYMKQNRIEEGRLSDRGEGLGTVTKEMVMKRAREIAVINGRSQNNVLDSDVDEAQRELQGEDEMKPSPTAAKVFPKMNVGIRCRVRKAARRRRFPRRMNSRLRKNFTTRVWPTRNTTRRLRRHGRTRATARSA